MEYVLLFVLGMLASFGVHELGHQVAASAYREKLDWKDGKWICRYPCDEIENIAIAGNLATAITGELLLTLNKHRRETPFIDGTQAFNTINPITYAYADSTTSGGYEDYRYVNDGVQAALAVHAASIGYRQYGERLWNLRPGGRGVVFEMWFK